MNQLQRQARASLALSKETVLSWYLGCLSNSAERVKALCVSHERLRAELEGSEILLADAEKRVAAALPLVDSLSVSPEVAENIKKVLLS